MKVICPYCGEEAELQDSIKIYKVKSYGMMYICKNFPEYNAYVSVDKNTNEPLGTMANGELRELRKQCHREFDELWRSGKINTVYPEYLENTTNREKAYIWLSILMGLSHTTLEPSYLTVVVLQVAIQTETISTMFWSLTME